MKSLLTLVTTAKIRWGSAGSFSDSLEKRISQAASLKGKGYYKLGVNEPNKTGDN